MATVKENLIAARALIDTPEKMQALSMEAAVLSIAPKGSTDSLAMLDALLDARKAPARGPKRSLAWMNIHSSHADIMDLLDRAIAAQDGKP